MPDTERKPLTPAQFLKRMREIDKDYDTEGAHGDADDLMCEILESLGYGEGVKTFKEMRKWYA